MAIQNQTFLEEALSAARGCWALVTGRHDAARYFDFTQRGLVGSFIALVLATGISVFGPMLLGVPSQGGAATGAVMLAALLFALQIAAAYLVLRQMGRLDGLVPFMVADNWVNFVVSLLGTIILVLVGGSEVMLFAVGIISIVIEVNIARRILTLSPMQVATFIVVQIVAQLIGILILGGVMMQSMPSVPAA